jgi:hypothetical protein
MVDSMYSPGKVVLSVITPSHTVRIDPELEAAARKHDGLAGASISTVIRVGLGVLADLGNPDLSIADLITRYRDRSHAAHTRRLT